MPYPIDNALFHWEDGRRAVQALGDDRRAQRQADRVIEAIRDELRLRIGSTFTVGELADLYGGGTDWCLAVAHELAPGMDARPLADAAFWRQVRNASDFAGGRVSSESL